MFIKAVFIRGVVLQCLHVKARRPTNVQFHVEPRPQMQAAHRHNGTQPVPNRLGLRHKFSQTVLFGQLHVQLSFVVLHHVRSGVGRKGHSCAQRIRGGPRQFVLVDKQIVDGLVRRVLFFFPVLFCQMFLFFQVLFFFPVLFCQMLLFFQVRFVHLLHGLVLHERRTGQPIVVALLHDLGQFGSGAPQKHVRVRDGRDRTVFRQLLKDAGLTFLDVARQQQLHQLQFLGGYQVGGTRKAGTTVVVVVVVVAVVATAAVGRVRATVVATTGRVVPKHKVMNAGCQMVGHQAWLQRHALAGHLGPIRVFQNVLFVGHMVPGAPLLVRRVLVFARCGALRQSVRVRQVIGGAVAKRGVVLNSCPRCWWLWLWLWLWWLLCLGGNLLP